MTDTKDTNPKDLEGTRKVPISCVPAPVMAEVGLALLEGARKYGRHNYRVAGVRASVYYDAAFRHLGAWWEGEDIDPDSGLSHVTKAIAGLCVLRDSMMRENWSDDRPPRVAAGWVREMNAKAEAIIAAHPNPKAPFTELEAAGAPLARGARLPEPAPAAAPAVRKDCDTCAHEGSDIHEEPCRACYVDIAQGWAPRTVCSTCRHDGDEDACAVCCSSEGIRTHWTLKP